MTESLPPQGVNLSPVNIPGAEYLLLIMNCYIGVMYHKFGKPNCATVFLVEFQG